MEIIKGHHILRDDFGLDSRNFFNLLFRPAKIVTVYGVVELLRAQQPKARDRCPNGRLRDGIGGVDLCIVIRKYHTMSEDDRNALIDAYFDAMDTDDLETVRPALTDDFVYESLSGDLEGFAGLETYMEELRGLSNTNHEVALVVHGETASVVEGTVTGDSEDGSVEADFCDVFEFDADEEGITRISVYLNDA